MSNAKAWHDLYKRAISEANGLTNYVDYRPELKSAEKRLDRIQDEARILIAKSGHPESRHRISLARIGSEGARGMIDAAKQALEALQDIDRLLRNMTGHSFSKVVIAIETLQAAIKQAEAAQQDDHKEQGE